MVGRDGSAPIMVCLVPLINKDQLQHFNHSMKVCTFLSIQFSFIHYSYTFNFIFRFSFHPNSTQQKTKNKKPTKPNRFAISTVFEFYYNMVQIQIVPIDRI